VVDALINVDEVKKVLQKSIDEEKQYLETEVDQAAVNKKRDAIEEQTKEKLGFKIKGP